MYLFMCIAYSSLYNYLYKKPSYFSLYNVKMIPMQKIQKYLWYIPALYVAYMFGNKIIEGFAHSEEFIQIISVIPPLKNYAYTLTPLVGLLDFCIGTVLLLNPSITKNPKIQKYIFIWVIVWPFLPSSLRYFADIAPFEIVEVLSISLAGVLAYLLWNKFTLENKQLV